MTELLKSKDIWGHTAATLGERLIQIGDNSFHEHGDYEKYIAEKREQAATLDERIKPQSHEIGLEIGSGTGVHTLHFAERSKHVFTTDVSDGYSDLFYQTTKGRLNISYTVRPFFPMFPNVEDGSADYGWSSAVFCHMHVYDIYLYFEELSKKLKSGGRFYVNFQNSESGPNEFFMAFLENYRSGGQFTPIQPAQMQWHSNLYFEKLAEHMGFLIGSKTVIGSYSEYIFTRS